MLCKHDVMIFNSKRAEECERIRYRSPTAVLAIFLVTVITVISDVRGAVETEEMISSSSETIYTSINRPKSVSASTADNQHFSHQRRLGWPNFFTDYVRCFCNLPVCVSSGYMCKSGGGGCFSDVQDGTSETRQAPSYQGRHGCLELITDKEQRAWCEKGNNSKSSTKKKQHPRSLFHCCYHDLCNHVDSPETRLLLNSSLFEETLKSIEDHQVREAQQDDLLYTNSDVWFRAATIALPICGLVIVIALVLLAVRLLQPEPEDLPNHKLGMPPYILTHHSDLSSRRHNRIIRSPIKSSHHHNPLFSNHMEDYTGQSYLPLIIQKDKGNINVNCDNKNETHAKFNVLHDNSSLLPYSFYDSREITVESDKYQKSNEYDYKENLNTVTDNNSLTGNRNCFCDIVVSEKTYGKEPIS